MNQQIFNFVSSLKVRFSRVAVVLVASFVMLLGTACSSTPSATGTGAGTGATSTSATELYRTTQPEAGGMNRYSDTDPRQNAKALGAEAKARVDQAKGNLNKGQTPKQFTDEVKSAAPIREGVKDLSDRAGDAIEGLKQDVTEGTQRGVKNLQQNTTDAKQGVKQTLDRAQDNAAQLGKDTSRNAQQAAEQAKSNLDKTLDKANKARQDLSDKASSLMDDSSRQVAKASDKTVTAIQTEAQNTPKLDTQDLLERVKDSFDTAARNVGEFAKDTASEAP